MPLIRIRRASAALAFAALLGSCTGRTIPPPGASGPEIYAAQRCGLCHGEEGEGGRGGPALGDLGVRWDTGELVDFFRRPGDFLRDDEALRALSAKYPAPMGALDELGDEHLRTLAQWLLSR